ncbi:hypothetical protein Phum_PHUM493250 [Pediculus humanus corporis]|uniref:Uncharacterized protein n=1 Tax=Pediculus humanus subsp. corporis TaxID=121224 RepID=E0VX19_PEDHC|nr:uncharacterized protein Phum_PHUM493250 [Pediculus humanus corporis]EEB17925.1 hypothetical protein Phum_PHUM493250 [Pediculus humanus corporis]
MFLGGLGISMRDEGNFLLENEFAGLSSGKEREREGGDRDMGVTDGWTLDIVN